MKRAIVIFVLHAVLLTGCKSNPSSVPKSSPKNSLSKEGFSDLKQGLYTDFEPFRRLFLSDRVVNSCVDYRSPLEQYEEFIDDEAAFDKDCKSDGGSVEESLSLQSEPIRRNFEYVPKGHASKNDTAA